ncbi:hypothetical protein PINS_up012399 [Pythium insidiosum]|nr:hypothetical protein PINS_up012399 [Pythium insidiosum]
MTTWKEDVHRPLVIDIFYDQNDGSSRVLLERWRVEYASVSPAVDMEYQSPYAARRQSSPAFQSAHHSSSPLAMSAGHSQSAMGGGSTRDVIQQLKEVCKKIAVLLRALHSFMRLLPAHRIFRQSYPSTLAYEIHSPADDATAVDQLFGGYGIATSQYSFLPITTPFGFLKVTAQYRRDCGALNVRQRVVAPMLKDNVIIQDYVPQSPELAAAADANAAPSWSLQSGRSLPDDDESESATTERRRRSTPETTRGDHHAPMLELRHHGKTTSQPMAIPHHHNHAKPVLQLAGVYDDPVRTATDTTTTTSNLDSAADHAPHPHSYADPDRLRTVGVNPNVAAAPYGYGNVAVERNTPPAATAPSVSDGQSGIMGHHTSITHSSSFQDYGLGSHPLSTPPRHPNSLLTPKTLAARASSGSRRTGSFGTSADYATRASLENFSLDASHPSSSSPGRVSGLSGSPTDVVAGSGSSRLSDRASTFHFRPSGDSKSSSSREGTESPRLSPAFMAATPPGQESSRQQSTLNSSKVSSTAAHKTTEPLPLTSAALVLRKRPGANDQRRAGPIPVAASSPPFHSNPAELLSTSPGYSYGKHYQAHYSRAPPMFISTADAPRDRSTRSSSFRLPSTSPSPSQSPMPSPLIGPSSAPTAPMSLLPMLGKSRAFSTDVNENGGGIWGVSPDTPDAFSFTIAGTTRHHRLLSSEDCGKPVSGNSAGPNVEKMADGVADQVGSLSSYTLESDLVLPFAMGDEDRSSSIATTVTATSTASDEHTIDDGSSTAQSRSGRGAAWDTASVGSFLQQLKQAPRLQLSKTSRSSVGEEDAKATVPAPMEHKHKLARGGASSAAAVELFDDELESFRSLRDDLVQQL